MSKSTKGKDPSLLTIEEAASILGVGQTEIQIRFGNGSLTKRRASNGEVRVSKAEVDALIARLKPIPKVPGESLSEYADRITSTWPPLTEAQQRVVAYNLYGIDHLGRTAGAGPSAYELKQREEANEREEALKKARKAALAMTACDVCNLQPDAHHFSQRRGIDSHEWTPGRAEKLMAHI